jgi:hypothetical protein
MIPIYLVGILLGGLIGYVWGFTSGAEWVINIWELCDKYKESRKSESN